MELTLQLPDGGARVGVTGPAERNLKLIREALGVNLVARNGSLRVTGPQPAVAQATAVLERLTEAAEQHRPLSRSDLLDLLATMSTMEPTEALASAARALAGGDEYSPTGGPAATVLDPAARAAHAEAVAAHGLDVYLPGKRVRAATPGQRAYLQAVMGHDLTFCVGPAGTGKTYLAVAAAAAMLRRGACRKLVLVRPAVEAGEKLGFLPGTMQEKVNPYLRPLLDALHDMMEFDQIQRFMAVDVIEIIPLAFMRGRTLNDAVVILDEAQNTTKAQMLMFLTRLGHGSKMIVTGDTSQIDLDDPRESGLLDAVRRLGRVGGVATVTLSGQDIVRHALVQRIVEAYGQEPGPAARRPPVAVTPVPADDEAGAEPA